MFTENWGGKIDIASELDGSVRNTGVPRYLYAPVPTHSHSLKLMRLPCWVVDLCRGLQDKHLRVLEKGKFPLSTNADEKDQGVYILTRFTKVGFDHPPFFHFGASGARLTHRGGSGGA